MIQVTRLHSLVYLYSLTASESDSEDDDDDKKKKKDDELDESDRIVLEMAQKEGVKEETYQPTPDLSDEILFQFKVRMMQYAHFHTSSTILSTQRCAQVCLYRYAI